MGIGELQNLRAAAARAAYLPKYLMLPCRFRGAAGSTYEPLSLSSTKYKATPNYESVFYFAIIQRAIALPRDTILIDT